MTDQEIMEVIQQKFDQVAKFEEISTKENFVPIDQDLLKCIGKQFTRAAQVVELTHKPTLTTKEVARLYGLHPDTLTKWRCFKDPDTSRMAKLYYIISSKGRSKVFRNWPCQDI